MRAGSDALIPRIQRDLSRGQGRARNTTVPVVGDALGGAGGRGERAHQLAHLTKSALKALADRACQVKETYLYTNPKTRKKKKRKRKIRKDSRTLYSCVISFPIKSEDALKDPAVFDEASDAIARAVNWQTEKLARAGGEMAMAVAHYDEAQVHVRR